MVFWINTLEILCRAVFRHAVMRETFVLTPQTLQSASHCILCYVSAVITLNSARITINQEIRPCNPITIMITWIIVFRFSFDKAKYPSGTQLFRYKAYTDANSSYNLMLYIVANKYVYDV